MTIAYCLTIIFTALVSICASFSFPLQDSLHCAVRKDISPCTCSPYAPKEGTVNRPWILVTCQKTNSFNEIVNALEKKFDRSVSILLAIKNSNLADIGTRKFNQIEAGFTKIEMSDNNMHGVLPSTTFEGIDEVKSLILSANNVSHIPRTIFKHMPNIEVLFVSSTNMSVISRKDFYELPLKFINVNQCGLSRIESNSLPPSLKSILFFNNNLTSLNGSILNLKELMIVDVSTNRITSLENEFPMTDDSKLVYMNISNNLISELPSNFYTLNKLEDLYAKNNFISTLNNSLSLLRYLEHLDLSGNNLHFLSRTEFLEATKLESLELGNNKIESLNGSLLPLILLKELNVSHNLLTEFRLNDISGLLNLNIVDLSHNRIVKFVGNTNSMLPRNTKVVELKLEHNELQSVEGVLSGLQGLKRLNMSHNKLQHIPPDFLHGLEELRYLDISHNLIISLQDTSKASLPALEELLASHNDFTELSEDIHGLPILCRADFTNNRIRKLKPEFAGKTQCKLYEASGTLRIILQGNPVLCDREAIRILEMRNNTQVHGSAQCQNVAPDEDKYNITNTDSLPITVITLSPSP